MWTVSYCYTEMCCLNRHSLNIILLSTSRQAEPNAKAGMRAVAYDTPSIRISQSLGKPSSHINLCAADSPHSSVVQNSKQLLRRTDLACGALQCGCITAVGGLCEGPRPHLAQVCHLGYQLLLLCFRAKQPCSNSTSNLHSNGILACLSSTSCSFRKCDSILRCIC